MIKKISIQVILFLMIPMSSLSSLAPHSYQLNNFGENKKSKVNIAEREAAERQATVQASLENPILLSVEDYHDLNPLKQKKQKKPWFHSFFYFSKKLDSYRKQADEDIKIDIAMSQEQDLPTREALQIAIDNSSKSDILQFIIICIILFPFILSICIASLPGLFFLIITTFLLKQDESRGRQNDSLLIRLCKILTVLLLIPVIIYISILIIITIFLSETILAIAFILTFLLDLLTFIPRKYFTKKEKTPQKHFLTLLITNQPLAKQGEFTAFLQNNLHDTSLKEIQNHSKSAQILIVNIEGFVPNHQNVPNTDNLDLVACAIKKLLLINNKTINKAILDLIVTLKLLVENKTSPLTDKDRYRIMVTHNLLVTLYNAHKINVFQNKEDIFNFQINVDESLNIPKDKIDPSIWMNKLRKSA